MNDDHKDEILLKLDMLQKLGALTDLGVKLTQNYNMHSNLEDMKYEYELAKHTRDKENLMRYAKQCALIGCYAMELINEKYDPFNVKLKGWTKVNDELIQNEQIQNIEVNPDNDIIRISI